MRKYIKKLTSQGVKKIVCVILSIFMTLTFCGCSFVKETSKNEDIVQLTDILQTLPFEYNIDGLREKYNLNTPKDYYIVDNAKDYCELLSDIGVPYEGPFDSLFEENVMFCYLRSVSGTTDFIPVDYFYYKEDNKIDGKTVYQPEPNASFPDVMICWCVDLVEVPRDIFEKLNKS